MCVLRLLASRPFSLVPALALASLAAGAAPAPRPAPTPAVTAGQLDGLEFRSIGPAIMGGSKTLADLNRQLFEAGFGRLDPGTPIE